MIRQHPKAGDWLQRYHGPARGTQQEGGVHHLSFAGPHVRPRRRQADDAHSRKGISFGRSKRALRARKAYTIEYVGGDEKNKVPQPDGARQGKGPRATRGRAISRCSQRSKARPIRIDTTDAILLVEDVGEAPYRIDRMLQQLKSAGKLAKLRGVVVGQFTETEPTVSKADQFVAFVEKCWRRSAATVHQGARTL